MIANSKRRWFTFSLRTLFVLVTLISLVLAWGAYERRLIRERDLAISWVVERGGEAWEFTVSGPEEAPWHLRLWGEYMSAPWIRVHEDKLKPEDKDRSQQIRKLVPEARFEVVHGSAKLAQ